MQRLHEQPEPANRPEAALEPPAPRAAEAILRLQRSAGNAAVGRMLQRKIGFELEAGYWRSAFLDRDPTTPEDETGVVEKTAPTRSPSARQAFYEAGNVRGTADELPGTDRDVEFIIKEQDESAADAIAQDFDRVATAYGEMEAKAIPKAWIWSQRRLGWDPPVKERWLLENQGSAPTAIRLQATAGLPLDQIAAMALKLDDESTAPQPKADDPRVQTGMHPYAGAQIAIAQGVANSALQHFLGTHKNEPAFADVGKLAGLVGLIARVLIGGKPIDVDDPPPSYPKAILPLLPRTDFVHMFATLPPLQQTALREKRKRDVPEFLELMWVLCSMLGRRTEEPIFVWDTWGQITHGKLLQDLTAGAWARGILAGQDRLSQSGYLAWLEERKAELPAERYEARKDEAKQLDSIANWQHKMDTRDGEHLPLVEFRALVRDMDSIEMTVGEAKVMGLRLAAYVDRLARRGVAWS